MLARYRKLAIPAAVATALAAAVPLLTVSTAQAVTSPAHRQIFSGTVVAAGHPVSGVMVKVYVMPRTQGEKGTLIGTATTAKNGAWSLPAPSYASLPKAAQQAAVANMGYLNTDAIVTSGSSFALAVESAWVGTPVMHTETSMDTPLPMAMRLTTATGAHQRTANCCGRFGCNPPILQKVLHRGHSYTAVGEWHAYWNASGGVAYTRGATSNIGSYASMNAGPFTFQGYDQFSSSSSLTMGFPSNGAFNSHEMVISLGYRMGRYVVFPVGGGGKVCATFRQVDETGLYDPGHGFKLWKQGKNVINLDGRTRYRLTLRHHARFIDAVPAGGQFTLTVGSGVTYGAGGSVFNIGIKAETNHSSMVAQTYKAGSSHKRNHWVWGNNDNLAHNPQVEYSY
jgi:hypothetical protein